MDLPAGTRMLTDKGVAVFTINMFLDVFRYWFITKAPFSWGKGPICFTNHQFDDPKDIDPPSLRDIDNRFNEGIVKFQGNAH
ncbi:hypothetical protein CMK20_19010 [Candidatus Poribacteria bacterium]|nr:hypothetical protein [Candidatus Poribacteria bacterium]